MNTRELQSKLDGGTSEEHAAQTANFVIDSTKATVGLSWFAALGKFWDPLTQFYKANGQYFFLLSLLLGYIGWVISAIELYYASNKNVGKISYFVYSTLALLLTVAVAVVFIAAGPFFGGILLGTSMFLDPVVNTAYGIFFAIKSIFETDSEIKRNLKESAATHAMYAICGGLISGLFVALMVLALPTVFTIPLALVGVGAMIAVVFLVPKLAAMFAKPAVDMAPSSIILEDEDSDNVKKRTGYYRNTVIATPMSSEQLDKKIADQISKIEADHTRDAGTIREKIWPQEEKRLNKIAALEWLKKVKIELAEGLAIPDKVSETDAPLKLGGCLFRYTDKTQLYRMILEKIPHYYPGVFQSLGAKIGDTQDCFNEVFAPYILNRTSQMDSPEETNLRNR